MKKFTQWVDVIREAEERKQSELQKSYKEYFSAKLNKFGAKSPADLTADQKAEFFNEIKKDWEAGTGAKPAGKKDVEEHGVKESEEFEMNEGAFYRLPRKTIENELWATTKNMQNFFNYASAGSDTDPGVLDSIIKSLEKIKKEFKKFSSKQEVSGTIYESEEINEANISMYKSMVQNALKDLDVEVKQSDIKVGTKKSDSWLFVTLNGHVLCSDTAYDQMVAWAKAAIKEDPTKYGLPASLKESNIFEAEVKNAKDFEEYAMALLKKKHGDDFDEAKAKKTISGISAEADKDGDWGAAVGKLQNS